MKLSSLNKFKGRYVRIGYRCKENNWEICHVDGDVEEVEEDCITIQTESGLQRSYFNTENEKLESIDIIDKETKNRCKL